MVPRCGYPAAENHHIIYGRNSITGRWSQVEIDGMVWPNVAPLCFGHHADIHRHEATISLPEKDSDLPYMWMWQTHGQPAEPLTRAMRRSLLNDAPEARATASLPSAVSPVPSPPGGIVEQEGESVGDSAETGSAAALSSYPGEPVQFSPEVSPGQKCPTCRRRVNHPKKESSPKTTKQMNLGPAPSSAVEELRTRVDELAEYAGISDKPFHRVKMLHMLLTLAEGVDKATLEAVAGEIPWAA